MDKLFPSPSRKNEECHESDWDAWYMPLKDYIMHKDVLPASMKEYFGEKYPYCHIIPLEE